MKTPEQIARGIVLAWRGKTFHAIGQSEQWLEDQIAKAIKAERDRK